MNFNRWSHFAVRQPAAALPAESLDTAERFSPNAIDFARSQSQNAAIRDAPARVTLSHSAKMEKQ
jgi:hypothetical protein